MRKRSRHTTFLGERSLREIGGRVALDNAARSSDMSASAPSYDRRKPGLLSTDTPELAARAVTPSKLGVDAVLNEHIGEQIGAGKLPNIAGLTGDVPKTKLPADTQYGRPRSAEVEWQDASVPKRAISAVDWGQVDNKPNIVTPAETEKFLTKKEANRLYRAK